MVRSRSAQKLAFFLVVVQVVLLREKKTSAFQQPLVGHPSVAPFTPGGSIAARPARFPAPTQTDVKNRNRPSQCSTSTTLHASLAITGVLSALDAFCQSSPYAAAAIICGFKASAADIVAQKRDYRKREEKRLNAAERSARTEQILQPTTPAAANATTRDSSSSFAIYNPNAAPSGSAAAGALQLEAAATTSSSSKIQGAAAAIPVPGTQKEEKRTDWKRNIAFLIYGSLYQGMTQEFVYNHLYPLWFGTATSLPVVLTKVCFDLFVQTTLVTLPIAYLTKSIIYQYSFKEAMRRYLDDIRNHGLLKKYFMLWGPVQCMTFSIIPEHWRVSFIACVSFFWLIILSTIASKKPEVTEAVASPECSLEDGLTCNIDG